jgi:hypothetical protein
VEADRHGVVHVSDRATNRVARWDVDLKPLDPVVGIAHPTAVGLYRDETPPTANVTLKLRGGGAGGDKTDKPDSVYGPFEVNP